MRPIVSHADFARLHPTGAHPERGERLAALQRAFPDFGESRAAIATFPKRQNPIAAAGKAWCPGGRTSAKPPVVVASIAAPAARRATS